MQMSTHVRLLALLASGLVFGATSPPQVPKLTDSQIADFWRAKNAFSEAQGQCSLLPNWSTAKTNLDKEIEGLRRTCGHEPVFGTNGHPSCGPDVPVAPAPAAKVTPDGK